VTLDDLRAFVAACEAGSLSAAARRLGITQPAVSQHVRRLERELAVTLFERGRRGVLPTPAGRTLLAAAAEALGAVDAGRRALDRLRNGETGALRLSTGGTTLRHFMVEPVARFRERHPGVTFDYVPATSTRECLDAVRTDRADLAFVTIGAGAAAGLEERPAIRTPWVLVTGADDPLASGPPPRPHDLRATRLIGMPAPATSRAQLEDQLADHGMRPTYAVTVDDWDTAVQLVALGVGQAIIPAVWVHDLPERGPLRAVPIAGLEPVTIGWAARRWAALPDHAHAFVWLVGAAFADLEATARVELVAEDSAPSA
jgi:DNA-binding transcriptional LysR family regulator